MLLLRIQGFPNQWLARFFGSTNPAIRYHLKKNGVSTKYPRLKIEIVIKKEVAKMNLPITEKKEPPKEKKKLLTYNDYLKASKKRQKQKNGHN